MTAHPGGVLRAVASTAGRSNIPLQSARSPSDLFSFDVFAGSWVGVQTQLGSSSVGPHIEFPLNATECSVRHIMFVCSRAFVTYAVRTRLCLVSTHVELDVMGIAPLGPRRVCVL